jgi:hypothetical protein
MNRNLLTGTLFAALAILICAGFQTGSVKTQSPNSPPCPASVKTIDSPAHLKPVFTWKFLYSESVGHEFWRVYQNHRLIGEVMPTPEGDYNINLLDLDGPESHTVWDSLDAAKAEVEAVYTDKVWK